ncbi:ABC transporter ATP-binding protein [Arthrobacter sp. Soil782]|uniref:ABC transporter ATP-binding protein n=1 Tax=Arthrobacter sp. Soil782 TaxID=1736410 RepID=UPI0006F73C93|nr:ABC transporter ATP-binding protein [Arthrobacter sp. Soil782]KRF08901.1 ABC transporter ATP-binding protein [Arthrobacter sp. Soil782]
MSAIIDVRQLDKSFGSVRALDQLNLTLGAGEVHGFLGPNGSGKSTTIRILLGLLRPDAGTTTIFGRDPWDAVDLHHRLAYVPGDVSLWPKITGGEAIDLFAGLRGGVDPARRNQLLERFNLDPTKKTRSYSKGNRQKVALIAALASDVELLIMDEPTSGLDPLMEREFQACIREVRAAGRTVLLSSHILAEVEALCDRVTIIRQGRTVQSGTLAELRHLRRTAVVVVSDGDATTVAPIPGIHDVRREDEKVHFTADDGALPAALAHLLPLGVRSLISTPPSLEELFLHQYGDGYTAATADTADGGR